MQKSDSTNSGQPALFVISPETREEEAILAVLSCSFGDNKLFHGTKPEHAFWPLTGSLTEQKPIICHEGIHYSFHLAKLQRDAYTLLGNLLRNADSEYWKDKFLPSRDEYLERETTRLFKVALPYAKVLTGMSYDLSGRCAEAETDVLILCDDFLIIAECKAGGIGPASRRGAVLSVEADVRKTIGAAQSQAERLVGELIQRGQLSLRSRRGGPEMLIKSTDFRWVARVSVTLELIAPAATALWTLEDAGILRDSEKCWSVCLNDLRVIVEILDSTPLFLHYLIRRMDLNTLRNVHARDELDFLMHYVERGLFFRGQNQLKPEESLTLVGFTDSLDQYYRRVQGISALGKKPKVRTGRRTNRMLDTLVSLRPRHYVTACLMLLEFDIPDREGILGKMVEHLSLLRDKSVRFGFSFTANSESKRGIALATSRSAANAVEVILGRAIKHCQDSEIDDLCVIVQGVPLGAPPIYVLLAGPDGVASDHAHRLLSQLRFEIIRQFPNNLGT